MDREFRRRWDRDRYRGHGGLIGGVILAAVGALLLLQNLGIPYFDDIERFWPVILIVIGIAKASSSVGMGGRVWGGIIFVAGFLFMLSNFNVIHGDLWRFFWPGILIMVGLGMLARSLDRQTNGPAGPPMDPKAMAERIRNRIIDDVHGRSRAGTERASSADHMSEWAIFGGVRRRIESQDFQGGEAFAMFGGVEVDLRKAAITRDEILIEANAIFGGIDLRLPETWNVTVRGAGIFGGYEDETFDSRVATDSKQPHVVINGFAVFGGVHIKN